jgi:2-iminobutanoate/2-iminopropanoate deaminase
MARFAGKAENVPVPAGPYSPSVRIGGGGIVAAAGQCGYLPDRTLAEGLEEQTRVALQNLRSALAASGASMDDVVSVEVFLTDVEDFAAMNAVYAGHFTEPYPARATVYVGLRGGALVEISALAVVGGDAVQP